MKLLKYMWLVIGAILLTAAVSNAQIEKKISDDDLKNLLARIDADTERFAKTADKAMDKSGFDGSDREDQLNQHLKNLRQSTEALKNDQTSEYAKGHFTALLHHGVSIENFLKKNPLDGVESDWAALRADLGELAKGFNITWEEGYAKGAQIGEADIKNLLQHIEDMADKYKLTLDAALDNSPLNNTSAEDEINGINSDFRAATRHLEDERNNPDGATAAAKDVLVKAKRIDGFLTKHNSKLNAEVQTAWAAIRTDLERLARLYQLRAQWK